MYSDLFLKSVFSDDGLKTVNSKLSRFLIKYTYFQLPVRRLLGSDNSIMEVGFDGIAAKRPRRISVMRNYC